jgi:hypothetical protein
MDSRTIGPWIAAVAAALMACSTGDDSRESASAPVTTTMMPVTTGDGETTPTSTGEAPTTTTGASASESGTTGADPTTGTSTGGLEGSSSGDGPKLDIGADSEGPGCTPDDTCCQEPGFIPPHTLLETFLAAYPAANMPKSDEELVVFEPVADGHMMAFSMENVGDEFIDPTKGGVIEANILAGRAYSRMFAEAAVPADATVLEVREDPVVIETLGNGDNGCIGVGWAWGSILFSAADKSIGELVFLYVGHCFEGDAEAFFYSEESVELCPPPG